MWLGTLESIMVYGNPENALVDKLIELSSNPGVWMYKIQPLAKEEIYQRILDWELAEKKEDRTTVTESTWSEPAVLTDPDLTPGSDKVEWLRTHPVFTIDAWKQTWGHSTRAAEDYLIPKRWNPHRELHDAKVLTVWRWNPLRAKQPSGRPIAPFFQPKSDASVPAKYFKQKLQGILDAGVAAGVTQVKIQEVAQVYYGRVPTTSNTLQRLRHKMVECGWEYNMYDKVWKPRVHK